MTKGTLAGAVLAALAFVGLHPNARAEPEAPSSEVVLWEGNVALEGWQPENVRYFLSDGGAELKAAGAEVGKEVRFYVTPTGPADPSGQNTWSFDVNEGHWNAPYRYCSHCNIVSFFEQEPERTGWNLAAHGGYVSFILTQDMLDRAYQASGGGATFLAVGEDAVITKITLAPYVTLSLPTLEHAEAPPAVYANDTRVWGDPYSVPTNSLVKVVYTAEDGYLFSGGFRTFTTNFAANAASISLDLSGIQFVRGKEMTLWEGEVEVPDWEHAKHLLSDGGTELKAVGAKAGQEIRFYITPTGEFGPSLQKKWTCDINPPDWDGARYSAHCGLDSYWDGDPDRTVWDIEAYGGCFSFVLTQAMLDKAYVGGAGGSFLANGTTTRFTKITVVDYQPVTIALPEVDHAVGKAYVSGFEVAGSPCLVSSNALVSVVYTAEDGYVFPGGFRTFTTNLVANADPLNVTVPADRMPVEEKLVWTGEVVVDEWAATNVMSDGGVELKAAGAKVGQEIRFYVTPTGAVGASGQKFWILDVVARDWSETYCACCSPDCSLTDHTPLDLETQGGYVSIILSQKMLDSAYEQWGWGGPFAVNGLSCVITKITLVDPLPVALEVPSVTHAAYPPKVYANGVEIAGPPYTVPSNSVVRAVYTAEEGSVFPGGFKTFEVRLVANATVTQVTVPDDRKPGVPNGDCLTFASEGAFSLAMNDGQKHWDGQLLWSRGGIHWKEWNGETVSSDEADADGQYRISLRGTAANTLITGEDGESGPACFVLTPADAASTIACTGNLETLRGATGSAPSQTQMAEKCYASLFRACASLTQAPNLPATALAKSCYAFMFDSCSLLKNAPDLPATDLPQGCYEKMFRNCAALTLNLSGIGKTWRIPADAQAETGWNTDMFANTVGTFAGEPEIGQAYFLDLREADGWVPFSQADGANEADSARKALEYAGVTNRWTRRVVTRGDYETLRAWSVDRGVDVKDADSRPVLVSAAFGAGRILVSDEVELKVDDLTIRDEIGLTVSIRAREGETDLPLPTAAEEKALLLHALSVEGAEMPAPEAFSADAVEQASEPKATADGFAFAVRPKSVGGAAPQQFFVRMRAE